MNSSYCNSGTKQSPINIKTDETIECNSKCRLSFRYLNSNIHAFLSENNIVLKYDNNSTITFNDKSYYLENISFTSPSSHSIDGSHYPLEMNLYHKLENKVIVISIFIQVNESKTDSAYTLDALNGSLAQLKPNRKIDIKKNSWNIYNAFPLNKTFFLYNGSLLNYPCTENAVWIIMKTPVNCSKLFYNNICKFSKNNSKRIQELNSRKIYIRYDKSNNKINNIYENGNTNNSFRSKSSRKKTNPFYTSSDLGRVFYGDESVYPQYYNYFGFDTIMYKMMALSGFYGEKPYRYISYIIIATIIIIFVLFCVFLVLSYNGTFNPLFKKMNEIGARTQRFFTLLKQY